MTFNQIFMVSTLAFAIGTLFISLLLAFFFSISLVTVTDEEEENNSKN
jgi:hypothetical protein